MWRDSALLLDMLLAAREVLQFTSDLTQDQFQADSLRRSGTYYQLQTIGEAASKISPDFKAAHPEIPWPPIIGLRHQLVHNYARINPDEIWNIIQIDVPHLISQLEPHVPPDEQAPPSQENPD